MKLFFFFIAFNLALIPLLFSQKRIGQIKPETIRVRKASVKSTESPSVKFTDSLFSPSIRVLASLVPFELNGKYTGRFSCTHSYVNRGEVLTTPINMMLNNDSIALVLVYFT